MREKLKIFIIGHKEFSIPKSDVLTPVQAGAAINKSIIGFLQDNKGEHISDKNTYYCELTAQYYAVKNEDADYYGFFHYRRYLNFSNKTSNKPYVYYPGAVADLGDFINLGSAQSVVSEYDLLLPRPENVYKTPYEHYVESPQHKEKKALENVLEIVREFYPQMGEDIEDYVFKNTEQVFGNIYIMKKDLAHDYLDFLVKVFTEFDKRYKDVQPRTQGFLAERLFGVYFYHKRRCAKIKYKHLQRVDVLCYFDKKVIRRIVYKLFPPSSKLRKVAKSLLKTSI